METHETGDRYEFCPGIRAVHRHERHPPRRRGAGQHPLCSTSTSGTGKKSSRARSAMSNIWKETVLQIVQPSRTPAKDERDLSRFGHAYRPRGVVCHDAGVGGHVPDLTPNSGKTPMCANIRRPFSCRSAASCAPARSAVSCVPRLRRLEFKRRHPLLERSFEAQL